MHEFYLSIPAADFPDDFKFQPILKTPFLPSVGDWIEFDTHIARVVKRIFPRKHQPGADFVATLILRDLRRLDLNDEDGVTTALFPELQEVD
jgi:hypothetical protein